MKKDKKKKKKNWNIYFIAFLVCSIFFLLSLMYLFHYSKTIVHPPSIDTSVDHTGLVVVDGDGRSNTSSMNMIKLMKTDDEEWNYGVSEFRYGELSPEGSGTLSINKNSSHYSSNNTLLKREYLQFDSDRKIPSGTTIEVRLVFQGFPIEDEVTVY